MKVKKSVKRVLFITLVVILLVLIVLLGIKVMDFFGSKSAVEKEIVNEIKGYGYTLEEGESKAYEDMFNALKTNLESEEIDEEEYAKSIAMMLVYDFYNLDNKVSKNDVGGVEFILDDYRSNFILEASETVYKYIEHDVYKDRKQQLPKVESTLVSSIKTNKYRYGKITDNNAYVVNVKVNYSNEDDLGYPDEVVVKMIHVTKEVKENDNKKTYNILQVFYMK